MPRLRHALLATAASIATVAALAGCGSINEPADTPSDDAPSTPTDVDLTWTPPEGLSGSLTIYSANPQALTDNLVAAFTEATGVQVEVFAGETGKITAKLDAEWDNPQADLVYLASWAPAANYAEQGRTLAYKPFGFDSIHEGWAPADGSFVGRDGSALALTVNTAVAPSIPSDWADLADPAFKDLVIMPDPRESGTAADLITAMVTVNGKDATWKLFDDLFANGLVVQGANGPALDDVTAGSHAVILGGVDYSAYSAIKKGESLQVVFASSGTTITPRPIFIVKGTKNEAAAKAFEDFMFSQQGQEISAAANMIPAQPSVPVASGTRAYDDVEQLDVDWDEIAANGSSVVDEFVSRYLAG